VSKKLDTTPLLSVFFLSTGGYYANEKGADSMSGIKIVKNIYTVMTICLCVVGAILIIWPEIGLSTLCKIFGIMMIVYGITKMSGYFTKDLFQLAFQFDFGLGIVSVIIGFLLLFRTNFMIEFLSICIGIFMLVDATLKIQTSIDAKKFGIEKWWLILLIALLVAVIGIILLFIPFDTAVLVTRLVGLSLWFDGVLNLIVVQSTVRTIKRGRQDVIDVYYTED